MIFFIISFFDKLPLPSYENSYPSVRGISDAVKIIEAHNNAYLHVQKGSYKSPESCWSTGEDVHVFAWKYNCFFIKDKLILIDQKYQIPRPEILYA